MFKLIDKDKLLSNPNTPTWIKNTSDNLYEFKTSEKKIITNDILYINYLKAISIQFNLIQFVSYILFCEIPKVMD